VYGQKQDAQAHTHAISTWTR